MEEQFNASPPHIRRIFAKNVHFSKVHIVCRSYLLAKCPGKK